MWFQRSCAPRPNAIIVVWLERHDSDLALSTIVIGEISFGIECIRQREFAPRLAKTLLKLRKHHAHRIYAFDEASALIYGEVMGEASKRGRNLRAQDGMIAAITLRHRATLATRNVKDFAGLGVKLMNPWEG